MAPPSASLQYYVQPWWIEGKPPILQRGRLVRTLVPFASQTPYTLDPIGRAEDQTDHTKGHVRIDSFRIGSSVRPKTLPLAALPTEPGTRYLVSRGKVRPAVVISAPGPMPPKHIRSGMASYQTTPNVLAAPYFGADQDGSRGGVPEVFLDRIRRGEYPQYMWDQLPVGGVNESYLRLDQVFSMGTNAAAFELTEYVLSPKALALLDQQYDWLRSGNPAPPDETDLGYLRTELLRNEGSTTTASMTAIEAWSTADAPRAPSAFNRQSDIKP